MESQIRLRAPVRGWLIVGKMGGCHLFRRSVATVMMENGAGIRVVQQMLGHANLGTRTWTLRNCARGSLNLLCQVCSATHRAAHLKRACKRPTSARDAEAEAELFDTRAVEREEDSEGE